MHALCECAAIPDGGAKGCSFNDQHYIAVREGSQFYLYLNRCPHLGIPLEWQPDQFMDADGELIRCSTHGALFEMATGKCIAGPCTGDALTAVPFTLADGKLWL